MNLKGMYSHIARNLILQDEDIHPDVGEPDPKLLQ